MKNWQIQLMHSKKQHKKDLSLKSIRLSLKSKQNKMVVYQNFYSDTPPFFIFWLRIHLRTS